MLLQQTEILYNVFLSHSEDEGIVPLLQATSKNLHNVRKKLCYNLDLQFSAALCQLSFRYFNCQTLSQSNKVMMYSANIYLWSSLHTCQTCLPGLKWRIFSFGLWRQLVSEVDVLALETAWNIFMLSLYNLVYTWRRFALMSLYKYLGGYSPMFLTS